jgi:hypothetical protein
MRSVLNASPRSLDRGVQARLGARQQEDRDEDDLDRDGDRDEQQDRPAAQEGHASSVGVARRPDLPRRGGPAVPGRGTWGRAQRPPGTTNPVS